MVQLAPLNKNENDLHFSMKIGSKWKSKAVPIACQRHVKFQFRIVMFCRTPIIPLPKYTLWYGLLWSYV